MRIFFPFFYMNFMHIMRVHSCTQLCVKRSYLHASHFSKTVQFCLLSARIFYRAMRDGLSILTEFLALQAISFPDLLRNVATFSNFWQLWRGVTQVQGIQISSSMSVNILPDATGKCCHSWCAGEFKMVRQKFC